MVCFLRNIFQVIILKYGKQKRRKDHWKKQNYRKSFDLGISFYLTIRFFKVTKDEILSLLRKMPLTSGVPEMLRTLKEAGSEFVIVSDANAIFIREPLDNSNLFNLFDKIFTNPAEFDEQGRLNMSPFTEQVFRFFFILNY